MFGRNARKFKTTVPERNIQGNFVWRTNFTSDLRNFLNSVGWREKWHVVHNIFFPKIYTCNCCGRINKEMTQLLSYLSLF